MYFLFNNFSYTVFQHENKRATAEAKVLIRNYVLKVKHVKIKQALKACSVLFINFFNSEIQAASPGFVGFIQFYLFF